MGAEQSLNVPGFNPQIAAKKKKQAVPMAVRKYPARHKLLEAQEWGPQAEDTYFANVDVEDHILPIYDGGDKRKKEALDDGIEGVVDLAKLLDELKDGDGGDSDGDLMDFPDYGDGESTSDAGTDDDERGMYHHEVEKEPEGEVDVCSPDAHPLAVKGECCIEETLKCQDLSDWRNQYPVYKLEWYLGLEVGNQTSFKAFPEYEGETFEIPIAAVGRYIQVVASRRVENQIHDTLHNTEEVGAYDAHVEAPKHYQLGGDRLFTDVKSTAVVGPVLISDRWSFTIMEALRDKEFHCAVKLRDEILESEEFGAVKGKVLSKVPAALTIMNANIEFRYVIKTPNKKGAGSSSLFAAPWLKTLLSNEESELSLEEQAATLTGEVAGSLRLKTVQFRLCKSQKTIILATKPRKKGYSHTKLEQDLIRFDPDPQLGREFLLYILFAFQGAQKFKMTNPEIWKEFIENGEVEQGKNIVQRYLEYLVTDAEEGALAYGEMPLTPWEY